MNVTSEQTKAIEQFVESLQERINEEFAKKYQTVSPPSIKAEYGRKYCKIVKCRNDLSCSVHCFIEISSGDIYKAATWNAPAKHVRGNINTVDHGMSAVGVFGANYLR